MTEMKSFYSNDVSLGGQGNKIRMLVGHQLHILYQYSWIQLIYIVLAIYQFKLILVILT